MQEREAPIGFVVLTDLDGRRPQPIESTEEPAVGFVTPPDIAAPPPPRRPQTIEPTVIANAMGGVPLDRVTTEPPDLSPRIEHARVPGDYARDGIAA